MCLLVLILDVAKGSLLPYLINYNVRLIFTVESMQRFQHRQLELHPSEAISHKDFDPFVALQKQRLVLSSFNVSVSSCFECTKLLVFL